MLGIIPGITLWVYGPVIDMNSDANLVPLDTADNWLHLVLGVGIIGLGVAAGVAGARAVRVDRSGRATAV